MKFRILFIFSISSVILVASLSNSRSGLRSALLLRQEVQLLENNALRNILKEQNLQKRSLILEKAMSEIQKLRIHNPLQLKNDEKIISKIVLNLKAMDTQNQAHYKEVP